MAGINVTLISTFVMIFLLSLTNDLNEGLLLIFGFCLTHLNLVVNFFSVTTKHQTSCFDILLKQRKYIKKVQDFEANNY